jgi:hypothetical protein
MPNTSEAAALPDGSGNMIRHAERVDSLNIPRYHDLI